MYMTRTGLEWEENLTNVFPHNQNKRQTITQLKQMKIKLNFLYFFLYKIWNAHEKKTQVGTGGMDSKVSAATWALDRGVSVVICNGTQDKAIKTIIGGRKVGTFFTETAAGGPTPVDTLAENGKAH